MTQSFPSLRNSAFRAMGAVALVAASAGAHAAPITVGQAAINRTLNDGFSNFVITLPGEAFLANGTIDKWDVYVAQAGAMGLLILNGLSTAPTVVHSLSQTTVAGFNSFTLGSALAVSAGDYLGIWMGNSKVDYDQTGVNVNYSPNGFYASAPTVGSLLNATGPNPLIRDYSINVRFTEASQAGSVPEPSTLALVGLSLIGLSAARRRKH